MMSSRTKAQQYTIHPIIWQTQISKQKSIQKGDHMFNDGL